MTEIPVSSGKPERGQIDLSEGFAYTDTLFEEDIVYGLGEANRGINKRGYCYVSDCSDDPRHTEDKVSLYGAHNFIIISGERSYGLYVDYPSKLTFDVGYTRTDTLRISCEEANLNLYVIEGADAYDIVKQFRKIIGRSYIPPKFAFGFGQSRWGYETAGDFEKVAKGYRENHIPMDMIYMDIDYMEAYKDFTINEKNFPNFSAFIQEMKEQNIRMIPIIDAGVKIEEGYSVYEEGVKRQYFCKREDGSDFTASVWPGETHFPDVLNPAARKWFGGHYRFLTEQGIEGFWNDMNEPAIFHTPERVEEAKELMRRFLKQEDSGAVEKEIVTPMEIAGPAWEKSEKITVGQLQEAFGSLANNEKDYQSFYHQVDGKKIRHDKVHNLFGYNMTRAAGEAFEEIEPGKRFLMFSRSSYIGMHRYGGIWTGDNASWWYHILLNLKMMPSLNMCGFLYIGADLGGFNNDVSGDLLLRWLALGVFTPLMRNHSVINSRNQECYQFENIEDFRHVVGVRYRLIPYLYSEYMKAALADDLYFKPLAFDYPEDVMAAQVEDQLLLGNEIMIAPVYMQNTKGRYVYLPEEMMFVKFLPDGTIFTDILPKGHHYVEIALNEVPLFIRKGKCIPVADQAEWVDAIDMESLTLLGYAEGEYDLYDDDGVYKDYDNPKNMRRMKM